MGEVGGRWGRRCSGDVMREKASAAAGESPNQGDLTCFTVNSQTRPVTHRGTILIHRYCTVMDIYCLVLMYRGGGWVNYRLA